MFPDTEQSPLQMSPPGSTAATHVLVLITFLASQKVVNMGLSPALPVASGSHGLISDGFGLYT